MPPLYHNWRMITVPMVSLRLGISLEDATILGTEYDSIARRLADRFISIGSLTNSYYSLTGTDVQWFDEAVALMVCARLLTPLTTGGAANDASSFKTQDGATITIVSGPGERERYIREAAEAIGRVASVKAAFFSRSVFRPFQVNGPTSSNQANGVVTTLMTELVSLLSPETAANLFADANPDNMGFLGVS